jgi:thiamine-monophosphate kinase
MGARPVAVLFAAAVPDAWRRDLPAIAEGVGAAVRAVGGAVVGGDLTGGGELSLTLTVMGAAPRPVLRSGARPGDALYVTGQLGGPRRALQALERGEVPEPGDRARFARPDARIEAGRWLAARGATALVDVSDGLAPTRPRGGREACRCASVDASRPRRARPRATRSRAARSTNGVRRHAAGLDAGACCAETGVALTAIGPESRSRRRRDRGVELAARGGRRVDLPPGHDHLTR